MMPETKGKTLEAARYQAVAYCDTVGRVWFEEIQLIFDPWLRGQDLAKSKTYTCQCRGDSEAWASLNFVSSSGARDCRQSLQAPVLL